MGLLDLCEKYFETRNLYDILKLTPEASEKDVKKAYHKLSLKVHPDRVPEDQKLEATEKFKVLGGIHSILSDKDKKALYDETKCVDDEDLDTEHERDWTAYWRILFKKITEEDIKAYEKEYIGSQEERKDLKQAYLAGKGNMDYIVDHVQFARSEHEPRLKEILNKMIKDAEIPSYKAFTHETEKKRLRRFAKENQEAKEAEEIKKEIGLGSDMSSLELMIKQRQESRMQQMDSLIDRLAAKYGGEEKSASKKRKGTPRKLSDSNKKRK